MKLINRIPSAHNATTRASTLSPTVQFLGAGGVFLIALTALCAGLTGGLTTPGTAVAVGFYVLALLLGVRALRDYPHRYIGFCNVVTVFRLMLASSLIATLVTPDAGPWSIFTVASLALLLDGVDGWLARREGYVSEFGAMFDMEVDAVLALTLALLAYMGGHVGAFIILLGLPRYIFWVAQVPMPWLMADLPARFSRKLVCVVQIAVLIAVLVPVLDRPVTDVMAGLAALALIWSFALDIRWLWQARP